MIGVHKDSDMSAVRAHEFCDPNNVCLICRDGSFQEGDTSLCKKALVKRAKHLCKSKSVFTFLSLTYY